MKYNFNSGDIEIKENGIFRLTDFSIISILKSILLLAVLLAGTNRVHAQSYITLRDTIFYSVDSFQVIESQIDTSNLYNKNIFFRLMDDYEQNSNPHARIIPITCDIPADIDCIGCDFEDSTKITTAYWGASVEKHFNNGGIISLADDACNTSIVYPIDIDNQCICPADFGNYKISVPLYFCNGDTSESILNVKYNNCSNSQPAPDSRSISNNHFRLVGYNDLYKELDFNLDTCSVFESFFGKNVLKIGDDHVMGRLSTLIKRIIVTPENHELFFDFALILENPHSGIDNPSFRVNIYNNARRDTTYRANGTSRVDLGYDSNVIFSHHPSLKIKGNLRYLNWSRGKIDLKDFAIGDTLYLLFEQKDCAPGGHWAKAYIDNIGGGISDSMVDEFVNYNTDLSYTCNDTITIAFNYELPKIDIDTQSLVGELEIVLRLSGVDSISSGIITNTNGLSGTHIFKVPRNILSDYVNTTFNYSTTSSIGCYNLVPYWHQQQIHLPTANICNPECASFSQLSAGQNVNNTYLLDDKFKVVVADNPTSGVIYVIKQGQNPDYYSGNGVKNGCINDKTYTAAAIGGATKQHHMFFLFDEPIETFSLKLLDYGPKKRSATIHGVYLTAYDSLGNILSVDSLNTIDNADSADACLATPSSKYTVTKHSGDYTFYVGGYRMKKIELSFSNNTADTSRRDWPLDGNMVVSNLCYIPCSKPEITLDSFICPGDTFRLEIANFRTDRSYSWTGPNGFTSNLSHVIIPNVNTSHSGTYILSAYSPNCGTMYDTVVFSLGNNKIRLLGADAVLCVGDTKTLSAATSGATYLWKGGATTSTVTVDTTGIYWVAVTKNGCTRYDTIKVTFIADPDLQSIPYKTRHNCIEYNSGILQLLWSQKSGGVLTSGTDPQVVTYIDALSYSLYTDEVSNGTFDAQCSWPLAPGTLAAGFRDSLFITGLDTGDYKIVLKPKTICRKVIEGDSITIDSVCIAYDQCYSDSISFTFTIRKHIYPSLLGPDKILCPGGRVSLHVPSRYYDALPPESIKWGTVCGIYDATYNISTKVADLLLEEDTLRAGLRNGQGGVHTVEVVTQDGCIVRDTIVVADLKPLIIPDSMPSALATNAVNYNSFWSTQYNNIKWQDAEMVESFRDANIYYTGEGGIFRPSKNHDYLDSLNTSIGFTGAYKDTTPSTRLGDINIRSTGNIMPYKLFNYGNPLFADCIPQWIHNSTMTKYSPSGFDIENKDIMGIYSSALYGYNDMLPIAVASNAKNDEIGYESFEEYSKEPGATNNYDSLTQLNNSTGNIDLVRQTTSLMMPKITDYEIVRAFNRYVMIKGNISNVCDDPFEVKVHARTVPIDIRTEKVETKDIHSVETQVMASPCGDSTYTILQLDQNTIAASWASLKCRFWTGSISIREDIDVPLIEDIGFELDDTKAHTGKYSLKVPKNENIFLPQTDMVLKPRQTYHIGAWIHTASMDTLSPGNLKHRHAADSIGIFVKLPNNEVIFIQPSGEVIDGWQKIEGTFTMPAGSRTRIQLGFHASEVFNIDDIRIYPQNSAIQTYVYDPNNYKVKAVLDQNNYATIYHYDDEGNLFAIKKETVKGIKTIQVSASHLKSER